MVALHMVREKKKRGGFAGANSGGWAGGRGGDASAIVQVIRVWDILSSGFRIIPWYKGREARLVARSRSYKPSSAMAEWGRA
jgi:hypothetical protein